jgi:opacity protein-like surface antigen
MMIRQSILALAVITAGTLSLAGQAAAAPLAPSTGDVTFTGRVPGACSFLNSRNGKVTKFSNTLLTSDPNDGEGGVSGAIDMDCTNAAVLSVANPVQLSGPTTTNDNAAIVYTSQGTIVSPFGATLGLSVGNNTSVSLPAGFSQQNIRVDTRNSSGSATLFAGDYSYKVTLTATPN